jgi:hypothetical protein
MARNNIGKTGSEWLTLCLHDGERDPRQQLRNYQVNFDKRVRSEDEPNSATVILISHLAKSHLQIILVLKFPDHVLYSMNTISALEPLPLRFCHQALREMSFGGAARFLNRLPAEAVKRQERERIPLERRGNPNDVSRWIISLADPAAYWVTGQVLAVEGNLGLV